MEECQVTERHLELMENRLSSSVIFPRTYVIGNLQKIQKDLQEQNFEPENFEERIIFMSTFNDIDWTRRGDS